MNNIGLCWGVQMEICNNGKEQYVIIKWVLCRIVTAVALKINVIATTVWTSFKIQQLLNIYQIATFFHQYEVLA